MIDLPGIRQAIILPLRNYLRADWPTLILIVANPDAPEPTRPFVVMHFTSKFIPEPGMSAEIITNAPNNSVKITREQQPTLSCSFTVYDDDPDEATNIGLAAMEYFDTQGYDYLQSEGIIVADLMPLQDRDVYQGDRFDRRVGFDVIFRVASSVDVTVPAILTVDAQQT